MCRIEANKFNSNAAIVPSVYFFYPETAYRSLEEMDTIFHKTTSIWDAVKVARNEPRRYGKNGELLIAYQDTDEHRRRSSVVEPNAFQGHHKPSARTVEHAEKGHIGDYTSEVSG